MNYTNNVPCHTMKPLERKFFKMVIRRLDYLNYYKVSMNKTSMSISNNYNVTKEIKYNLINPMNEIVEEFCNKYGVGVGICSYYLSKWTKKGFYKYENKDILNGYLVNVPILLGIENDNEQMKKSIKEYSDIIPERVYHLAKGGYFYHNFAENDTTCKILGEFVKENNYGKKFI